MCREIKGAARGSGGGRKNEEEKEGSGKKPGLGDGRSGERVNRLGDGGWSWGCGVGD